MSWETALTRWYTQNKREMPWRGCENPYFIWVSEIMLQQTQVDTVTPYFNRFISQFPTIESLAESKQEPVLKAWEGLGYYSRARNLHKAAQIVCTEHNGKMPSTYEGLQELPGLGPYCAAAVASIAFGHPIPVVDGNVLRVFARFWGIEDDIRQGKVRDALFKRLIPSIEGQNPSDFNQAMMELGALICKPKNPKCKECPLSDQCYAYKNNQTETLPYKSKSAKVPHHTIVVGVISKDGKVLIGKRRQDQMLGGLWEFPGGKCEPQEKLEDALQREILEETKLKVTIRECFCTVNHAYTHFKITMHAFWCDYKGGDPIPLSAEVLEWVPLSELHKRPFPKANHKMLEFLIKLT